MDGVVSLLGGGFSERVLALWDEMERDLGLQGVYATPFPHISYAVAASYPAKPVVAALEQVAARFAPFSLRVAGLGLFTGSSPVLYLSVVREPALNALHAAVWQALIGLGDESQQHYAPPAWIPHITLGFADLSADSAAEAVRSLVTRDFAWNVPIDALTLIYDEGDSQSQQLRAPLLGARQS
jgi:hypothetical protein